MEEAIVIPADGCATVFLVKIHGFDERARREFPPATVTGAREREEVPRARVCRLLEMLPFVRSICVYEKIPFDSPRQRKTKDVPNAEEEEEEEEEDGSFIFAPERGDVWGAWFVETVNRARLDTVT